MHVHRVRETASNLHRTDKREGMPLLERWWISAASNKTGSKKLWAQLPRLRSHSPSTSSTGIIRRRKIRCIGTKDL